MLGWILKLVLGLTAWQVAWAEACDIPGSPIKSIATTDAANCAKLCQDLPACKAYVFVSGWGRCFLKDQAKKPIPLRMHAAQIEGEGGARKVGAIREDHDESGKDLRRVSGIKTAQACAEQCLAEQQCMGMAFLDGYSDCWLKKTRGKLRPKTFTCAVLR